MPKIVVASPNYPGDYKPQKPVTVSIEEDIAREIARALNNHAENTGQDYWFYRVEDETYQLSREDMNDCVGEAPSFEHFLKNSRFSFLPKRASQVLYEEYVLSRFELKETPPDTSATIQHAISNAMSVIEKIAEWSERRNVAEQLEMAVEMLIALWPGDDETELINFLEGLKDLFPRCDYCQSVIDDQIDAFANSLI